MKLALIYDCSVQKSFYVKDKVAYDFQDNEPYIHIHSISPSCYVAGWNYTFLWDGGYFLNIQELIEDELDFPDVDFDLILYANERAGLDDDSHDLYSISRLRDKYPNAKIFGWFKEIELSIHNRETRTKNRLKFLKECDVLASHGITTMKNLGQLKDIEESLNKKIDHYISCPINIDYYYDNFHSMKFAKEKSIFAYLTRPVHRRGKTYEFCNYLGDKYNIPVKFKPLEPGLDFNYLSQKDFIELWSPSLFHINMDPVQGHPGQQCIQVACVGSVNLGGLNESHHILFPDTATNDENILEEKFKQYLNDDDELFKVIEYSWNKLNENYSFDVVQNQLLEIVNKL